MKMFIASPIAVHLLSGKFANEKRYLEAPSCVCRVVYAYVCVPVKTDFYSPKYNYRVGLQAVPDPQLQMHDYVCTQVP